MRRRCILHVGSPKTGMRTIQFLLKKNRKRLLREDILVPTSGQRPYGAHHDLAYDLAGLQKDSAGSGEEAFITEVAASPARTVLISSENLWPILVNRKSGERVLQRLRSMDFEIAIVLYVRNQPQYLNSSYVQNVKTLLWGGGFPAFAHHALSNTKKFYYSHWIRWSKLYGAEMLVRPYSAEVRGTGIPVDFLTTIGLTSTKRLDTAIERNVSVGPFSVETARSLLRLVGGPDQLDAWQAEQCRSVFWSELKRHGVKDRGYCGLTTSFAAEVEQRFAEDNLRFSEFAWGRPWRDVFASDIGLSYQSNDYAATGVPIEQRSRLRDLLASLEPKLRTILGQKPGLRTANLGSTSR